MKVSIPYGKGKEKIFLEEVMFDTDIMYQFPMGKVKSRRLLPMAYALIVYQFPMGKVKNNILRCVFIIIHRYRFVK